MLSAKNPNLAAGFVPGGVYHQLIVIMVYAGIKDGIPLCKLYTLDAGILSRWFYNYVSQSIIRYFTVETSGEGIERVYLKI